jgi:hypothetical protein
MKVLDVWASIDLRRPDDEVYVQLAILACGHPVTRFAAYEHTQSDRGRR